MRIVATAVEFPDTTTGVDALESGADQTVIDQLGIKTVATTTASNAELAAAAATKLLATNEPPSALIVIEGRVPERLMASEATRVQALAELDNATTFTVGGLGCVSVNAALFTARGLLTSGYPSVMLVHGSTSPTPRAYRKPVTVNGAGGIAVLLDAATTRPQITDILLESNGEYWDLFSVDYKDRPVADWFEECSSLKTYSFKLAIESRNRFTSLRDRLLERNSLVASDVAAWMMQNLSTGAFNFYEQAFGIQFAKSCRDNLSTHGHLGSMDILLNLHTAIESGEVAPGDKVVVFNNSPVAAWAAMLVEV